MQLRLSFCALVAAMAAPLLFAADDSITCPVTTPPKPPFVPPAPYRPNPPVAMFWYGTPALWARLPMDATWHGNSVADKLFLWRQGYDESIEPEPDITVAIKRLNDPYPDVVPSHGGTNAFLDGNWAMLTSLDIPTTGCWEVRVSHANATLTFVVSVQPHHADGLLL
jgi:hypothetical protein